MTQAAEGFIDLELTIMAPRSAVWRALVEPDLFAQWYPAPDWALDPGFLRIDPRVGGLSTYAVHKEGEPLSATAVTARFTEVADGARLVSTETVFGASSTQGVEVLLEIGLSDVDAGTLVTVHQGPLPAGVDDLAETGWRAALERLAVLAPTI